MSTDIAKNNALFREQISEFESALLAIGGERRTVDNDAGCPLTHRFVPGMYCREIFMPAGTVMTTMIHNYEHFAFILKGKARVISEDRGDEIIEAPQVIITKAGTKRVLQILEDMVWCTVHLTENNGQVETKQESDLGGLEKIVVSDSYDNYLQLTAGVKEKLSWHG